MRVGPLSDPRVRALIREHLVGFYFCFRDGVDGPMSRGHDDAARKMHARLLRRDPVGKRGLAMGIPPAIVASPGGKKRLGLIDVGAQFDPETFRTRLTSILREHGYLELTRDELELVERVEQANEADRFFEVASIYARRGDRNSATKWWQRVVDSELPVATKRLAYRKLIENARLSGAWKRHAGFVASLAKLNGESQTDEQRAFMDLEAAIREIRWSAERDLQAASERLARALHAGAGVHGGSMHYYAGVAAFLRERLDEAYFHWWYFVDNNPDHALHLKAYLNLAAKSYPFRIPELDNYVGARSMVYGDDSPPQRERERTRKIYERMLTSKYGRSFATAGK